MKNRTRIAALSLCIGLAAGAAATLVLARTEAVAQAARAHGRSAQEARRGRATKRTQRS